MAEITIKSVEGNPLNINVVMTAVEHSMLNGEIVTETVDFYPDTTKPVRAYLDCTTARKQFCPTTYVDGNIVYLSCDNATAGVYTLTVTCTDTNGKARRYKSDACIEVYDLTSAAEIAGTFDEQTYEMNGVFYTFGGGGATVQSDWDESNPDSPAYIRNKPNLSDYATDEELQAVADTFNDSAAAQITDGDIEYWNNKSDFSGSYNDLTDKPTIPPAQVQSDWNQTNTSAKDYIKNKPTIPQGVVVDSSLSSTSENPVQNKVINNALNGKQSTIADLNDIRNGAAAGATAYQKPSGGIPKSDLAQGVQTSLGLADTALQDADLTPIENDIDAIEAKIPSAASSSNQLADKAFVNSSISTNTATFKGTFNSLAELQAVTGATNNDYGFVIEYDQQGNEYYDRYKYNGTAWVYEYKIESTPFTAEQWAAIQSGITSGDVDKLAALPTNAQLTALLAAKQDTINDLATIRSGASAGATAYQKPSGGIPKSDLSSAVQTSLGKADTALQSYTETDPVFSASPAAGITSSDITEWDGKAEPTPVVNHGTSDTTFAMTPNVLHIWGTVTSLTLTLATPTDSTIVNEYMFQFTSGTTATTLSLPSTVTWDEDKGTLTVESGYIYQVSILNNIALWARVAA